MLNFALGLALFALSSYIGLRYKKRCVLRASFYSELYDFASYLAEQIAYSKTPLPALFKSFSLGKESAFAELLIAYFAELVGKIPEEYKVKGLSETEKTELFAFFRNLGKSDAERELARLAESKQRFKIKKETVEKEVGQKGKLYFKLAVIIGIALMIIVL